MGNGGGRSCSVPGCGNNWIKTQGVTQKVSYYSFPGRPWEIERRNKWIQFVKRKCKDGSEWVPTESSKICSDHFVTKKKCEDPRAPNYNPTIHPGSKLTHKSLEGSIERYQRILKRTGLLSPNPNSTHVNEQKTDFEEVQIKIEPCEMEMELGSKFTEHEEYDENAHTSLPKNKNAVKWCNEKVKVGVTPSIELRISPPTLDDDITSLKGDLVENQRKAYKILNRFHSQVKRDGESKELRRLEGVCDELQLVTQFIKKATASLAKVEYQINRISHNPPSTFQTPCATDNVGEDLLVQNGGLKISNSHKETELGLLRPNHSDHSEYERISLKELSDIEQKQDSRLLKNPKTRHEVEPSKSKSSDQSKYSRNSVISNSTKFSNNEVKCTPEQLKVILDNLPTPIPNLKSNTKFKIMRVVRGGGSGHAVPGILGTKTGTPGPEEVTENIVKSRGSATAYPISSPNLTSLCESIFTNEKKRSTQKSVYSFKCSDCDETYIKWRDLISHKRRTHLIRRKVKGLKTKTSHMCEYCGKTYVRQSGLKLHIKYVHEGHRKPEKEVVVCHLCGQFFSTESVMRKHIRGIHLRERPHGCHLCEKRFKSTHSLKYHLRTHVDPNMKKRGLNKDRDEFRVTRGQQKYNENTNSTPEIRAINT